jgi:uncharacterized protein YndB with AHSA1/START domain
MSMILKSFVAGLVLLGLTVFVTRHISSTVTAERTFNAPISNVWAVWTNAESMKKWWSPKDYTAPVIENDFKVGGKFLFSMKSPQGEIFWNAGHYQEIVLQQKIVSVMSFADEHGNLIPGAKVKVPGVWPDEIPIIVEFTDLNGKTKVTVEEKDVPLIMKPFATMGWKQQFDKLEALL